MNKGVILPPALQGGMLGASPSQDNFCALTSILVQKKIIEEKRVWAVAQALASVCKALEDRGV